MMQQNVAMPDLLKDVLRLAIQLQLASYKRLELQVGPLSLIIEMKQSRQVDRARRCDKPASPPFRSSRAAARSSPD